MAVPEYTDEVLVKLTSVNPPDSFAYPNRRIFLSKEKPVISLGRTSKRNSSLDALGNNGWFDSAVISRDHAELRLDHEKQNVLIKDTGSLHGTFRNEVALRRNDLVPLSSGDLLRFGAAIDRGSHQYPPCVMEVNLEFGTTNPHNRPKTFRVPDDTDVDEMSSDEDHSIQSSSKILEKSKIRIPAWAGGNTIDLTEDLQYPSSTIRDNPGNNMGWPTDITDCPPTYDPRYVDLTTQNEPDRGQFSPIQPENLWTEETEEQAQDAETSSDASFEFDSDEEASQGGQSESMHDGESDESDEDDDMRATDWDEYEEYDSRSGSPKLTTERDDHDDIGMVEDAILAAPLPPMTDAEDDAFPHEAEIPLEDHTMEQVVQNHTSTVGKAELLADSQLPPIEHPDMNTCPSNESAHASLIQLPSFLETVAMAAPFYERAGSQAKQILNPPSPQSQPQEQPQSEESRLSEGSEEMEVTLASNLDAPDVGIPTPLSPSKYVGQPTAATSAWSASGDKFLNSPPQEPTVADDKASSMLDETSAYQFELSKKAVDTEAQLNTAAKRTPPSIENIVEPPLQSESGVNESDVKAIESTKRKAEEISHESSVEMSHNTPGEGTKASERAIKRPCTSKLTWHPHDPKRAIIASSRSLNSGVPAPHTHRMKRVAEVVGYAALGGVAVMSALIATAPTL